MVGWSFGKYPAELEPVSTEGCVYIRQATYGITGSGVQDVGAFGRCFSANPLVYLQSRKIGICDVCLPGLCARMLGQQASIWVWPVGTTAGEQRMGGKGGSVETSLLSLAPAVAAPSSQPSSCRTGSCGQFPSRGPWAPVRPPPAIAPLASRWSWLLALLISAFSPPHPTFHICCHLGDQFPALNSLSCLFLR